MPDNSRFDVVHLFSRVLAQQSSMDTRLIMLLYGPINRLPDKLSAMKS